LGCKWVVRDANRQADDRRTSLHRRREERRPSAVTCGAAPSQAGCSDGLICTCLSPSSFPSTSSAVCFLSEAFCCLFACRCLAAPLPRSKRFSCCRLDHVNGAFSRWAFIQRPVSPAQHRSRPVASLHLNPSHRPQPLSHTTCTCDLPLQPRPTFHTVALGCPLRLLTALLAKASY
jgi:hypothetical protein